MKRKAFAILALTIASLLSVQGAYSWGSLTHAFITNQICARNGVLQSNVIYGSTAPDFVNYMFDSPYLGYLMNETHVNYLRVWKMARGGPAFAAERAAAYGYVAHNDEDYTAHTMSQTLDPASGYVIQKAAILNSVLAFYGVWDSLGIADDQYAALREELSHELVEFAGDFLIAANYPGTGLLLSNAANARSTEFPELLVRAYAGNLVAFSNRNGIRLNQPAAAGILTEGEFDFRYSMMYYGQLFASSDPNVILGNMAIYLQTLASQMGITIADPSQLIPIIEAAVGVIQDDFGDEMTGTVQFTLEQLANQKVRF